MKTTTRVYPVLFALFVLFLWGCTKSVTENNATSSTPSNPGAGGPSMRRDTPTAQSTLYPIYYVGGCSMSPSYGDSILYPQSNGSSDYIVSPLNGQPSGKYFSWPVGLAIDSTTGAIDVTKSETGMRYDIGFIQSGSQDTCVSDLIVAGSSYVDSAYALGKGTELAAPYFNANLNAASPCNSSSNSPGCAFDVTGSAAAQKVIVSKSTGQIDLIKTLYGTGFNGGAFGWLPYNGQTVTTTIYYRLNDASNNSVQQITVQLVYYDYKFMVPPALLNDFEQEYNNLESGKILSSTYNPRPPLVVIVRNF